MSHRVRPSKDFAASDSRRRIKQEGQRKARIEAAIARESLGEHPEQAAVRLEACVYMPGDRLYYRLPGWKVELLVSEAEQLADVKEACEAGIRAWLQGRLVGRQILCRKCKGDLDEDPNIQ